MSTNVPDPINTNDRKLLQMMQRAIENPPEHHKGDALLLERIIASLEKGTALSRDTINQRLLEIITKTLAASPDLKKGDTIEITDHLTIFTQEYSGGRPGEITGKRMGKGEFLRVVRVYSKTKNPKGGYDDTVVILESVTNPHVVVSVDFFNLSGNYKKLDT